MPIEVIELVIHVSHLSFSESEYYDLVVTKEQVSYDILSYLDRHYSDQIVPSIQVKGDFYRLTWSKDSGYLFA